MARLLVNAPGGPGSGGAGGGASAFADILSSADDPLATLRIAGGDWEPDWDFRAERRALAVQAFGRITSNQGRLTITAEESFREGAAGNGLQLGLRDRGTAVANVNARHLISTPNGTITLVAAGDHRHGVHGNGLALAVRDRGTATTETPGTATVTLSEGTNTPRIEVSIPANWRSGVARGAASVGWTFRVATDATQFAAAVTPTVDIGNMRVTAPAGTAWDGTTVALNVGTSFGTGFTFGAGTPPATLVIDTSGGTTWQQLVDAANQRPDRMGLTFLVINGSQANNVATNVAATALSGGSDQVGEPPRITVDEANERITLNQSANTALFTLLNTIRDDGLTAAAHGTNSGGPATAGDYSFLGGLDTRLVPALALVPPHAEVALWATGRDRQVGVRLRLVPTAAAWGTENVAGTAGNTWDVQINHQGSQPLGTVSVDVNTAQDEILLIINPNEPLSSIIGWLDSQANGRWTRETVGNTSDASLRLSAGAVDFTGGVDNVYRTLRVNSTDTVVDITNVLNSDSDLSASLNTGAVGATTIASLLGTTITLSGAVAAVYAHGRELATPNAEVYVWAQFFSNEIGFRLRFAGGAGAPQGAAGNGWNFELDTNNGNGRGVVFSTVQQRVFVNQHSGDSLSDLITSISNSGAVVDGQIVLETIGDTNRANLQVAQQTDTFRRGENGIHEFVRFNGTDTIAQLRALLDASGEYSAVQDGTTSATTFAQLLAANTNVTFAGGVDEEPLTMADNAATKTATVRYHETVDRFSAIKAVVDAAGYSSWYHGSVTAATVPIAPPFIRPVGGVSVPGDASSSAVDSVARAAAATAQSEIDALELSVAPLPLVFIAAVEDTTPTASEFMRSTRRPARLSWTGRRRIAVAYPATESAPAILLNGVNQTGLTDSVSPITLNGISHDYILTRPRNSSSDTLVEVEFAEDWT